MSIGSHYGKAKSVLFVESLERRLCLSVTAPSKVVKGVKPVSNLATPTAVAPPRITENLGRGVVAVRSSTTQVFISWRLLGLDPAGIGFNLYRSNNGGAAVKLNATPLTAGTNYTDTPPSLALTNTYYVRPVIGGVEQPASTSYTLPANAKTEPMLRIPITAPPEGYRSKSIWVGDLNGDGEFDYVIDRLAPFYVDPVTGVENNDIGTGNQFLEAFTSKGVKLWSIDMGPTSRGTYNISPGAATLSMGMWDGATVQDLNGDGKAEVILKIANGVKFPDGTTFTTTNDQRQFIAVLDGMTGNKLAQLEFPTDHAFAGRLSTMLGVGYLGGSKPSIVAWLRNRNPDTSVYGSLRKAFNDIIIAWDWNGGSTITQKWKLPLKAGDPAAAGIAGFHQMRIIDVNGDGYDDVLPGNYAVNGKTGTIIYKLPGIEHGDRFHVGDFDPDRPGLEGFGIQQNDSHKGEANAILDYYYDATNGTILWTDNGVGYDVGRGAAGDVDPSKRGYEFWSFEGIHNGPTHELVDDDSTGGVPWPNLRIWWDGDLGSEELDTTVINKYNPVTKTTGRLVTGYKLGATTNENFPGIYGDIMGDWREEAVYFNSTWSELLILTTNVPTPTRLYTLSQNAPYRNSLTIKGYYQSSHLDYYLGTGMTTPPPPNIVYAGTQGVPVIQSYQAETAVRSTNVTVATNYSGFNGTGFTDFPATGGSITWNNVDGGTGNVATIRFRYALSSATSRTGKLTVNGVEQNITFAPTGAWNTWATVDVNVPLNAGRVNTIRLDSTGQDMGNVDELQVETFPSAAPVVRSFAVNDGSAQRSRVTSLTVTFDRDVTLSPGAVTLWWRPTAAATATAVTGFTLVPAGADVYTLTFPAATFAAGSLGDGLYELRLAAALVASGTVTMAANAVFSFHRLGGDIDGNRTVNFNDFLDFQNGFGATIGMASYRGGFDFDDNSVLDFNDFLVLQNQFSKII